MEPITFTELLEVLRLARKYAYWHTAESGTERGKQDLARIDSAIKRAEQAERAMSEDTKYQ